MEIFSVNRRVLGSGENPEALFGGFSKSDYRRDQ